MNPLEKLLGMYYNRTECARALGVSTQCLNNWITKGFVPFRNGEMVQEKTKGKIKASAIFEYAGKVRKLN